MTKSLFESKVFWWNVASFIVEVLALFQVQVTDPKWLTVIVTGHSIGNIALRYLSPNNVAIKGILPK